MNKREATTTAEYRIHQFHWLHAKELIRLKEVPTGDPVALECSALLLVAFAVEAHANWLLEMGCPNEYAQERTFFSREPYGGTLGKLAFLGDRLETPVDRGSRPFQSLEALFNWRDQMVHARVERIERIGSFTDPSQLRPPQSELLSTPEKSRDRFMSDAEVLADTLQAAAEQARWRDVHGSKAFSGFLGLRGISLHSNSPA